MGGVKKVFKKVAPVIGGVVGGAMCGPWCAAIGTGLGGLAGGHGVKNSLMMAGMAGISQGGLGKLAGSWGPAAQAAGKTLNPLQQGIGKVAQGLVDFQGSIKTGIGDLMGGINTKIGNLVGKPGGLIQSSTSNIPIIPTAITDPLDPTKVLGPVGTPFENISYSPETYSTFVQPELTKLATPPITKGVTDTSQNLVQKLFSPGEDVTRLIRDPETGEIITTRTAKENQGFFRTPFGTGVGITGATLLADTLSKKDEVGDTSGGTDTRIADTGPMSPTEGDLIGKLLTKKEEDKIVHYDFPTMTLSKDGGIINALAIGGQPRSIADFPRRTGQINGPGTGTSDDVPAMLSDGEFVMTSQAVRNAGGGSRALGARKMYNLMNNLERGVV